MKTTIGPEGLRDTFQSEFPPTTICQCGGDAQHAFTVSEEPGADEYIYQLHDNGAGGEHWPHDVCAVAVYFCRDCLKTVALFNQA